MIVRCANPYCDERHTLREGSARTRDFPRIKDCSHRDLSVVWFCPGSYCIGTYRSFASSVVRRLRERDPEICRDQTELLAVQLLRAHPKLSILNVAQYLCGGMSEREQRYFGLQKQESLCSDVLSDC